jgi:ferritin-like metal-binding protein YciE
MTYLNRDEKRLVYIDGLQNAHAMETQAIQLLTRQIERLEHYPDMEAKMRQHISESEVQRSRIEQILTSHSEASGARTSSLKDMILGLGGNIAAGVHAPASDEIIKNTLANFAFEHFEMAAYKTLIVMAEAVGDHEGAAVAKVNLSEEEAMAAWIDQQIASTTLTFLNRTDAGIVASH